MRYSLRVTRAAALVVLIGALNAVAAQSFSVDSSAYRRTRDVLAIWDACTTSELAALGFAEKSVAVRRGSDKCGDTRVTAILSFVDGTGRVPSFAEIAEATSALQDALRAEKLVSSGAGGRGQGSGGFIGLPSVALVATDFLIARAKAELVQSAFIELVAMLDSSYARPLFGSTRRAIAVAPELNYRTLLPSMRAALREDLGNLPVCLSDAKLDLFKKLNVDERARHVSWVAKLLVEMNEGADFLTVAADVGGTRGQCDLGRAPTWRSELARVAVELQALRAYPSEEIGSSLTALLRDPRRARVFVQFFSGAIGASETAAQVAARIEAARALVAALSAVVESIATATDGEASDLQMKAWRIGAAQLTGAAIRLAMQQQEAGSQLPAKVDAAITIWRAVDERDYPRVVILLNDLIAGTEKPRSPATDSAGIPSRILRLSSFAAAVAAAGSNDELESAMIALVDPVGSFRSRRQQGATTLAIVSYVGASTGTERVDGGAKRVTYGGAFAPIGLEVARGLKCCVFSSIGLNVSFIDLGTLVSYRFEAEQVSGDDVGQVSEATLKSLISPSIHLTLGITRKYPLTLGVGVERSPDLRALETSGDRVSVNRFSIFLGVDLSLFRF